MGVGQSKETGPYSSFKAAMEDAVKKSTTESNRNKVCLELIKEQLGLFDDAVFEEAIKSGTGQHIEIWTAPTNYNVCEKTRKKALTKIKVLSFRGGKRIAKTMNLGSKKATSSAEQKTLDKFFFVKKAAL